MSFSPLNLVILTIYLTAMVLIGVLFARRQKTGEDYFLAGRNMPWLPVAMSMYASLTSATTYLALPGKAYSENISLIVVCFVSPLLAPVLIFVFYPFYRRLRVTTSYEYLGARFGRSARVSASALFMLARLGWLGVVIYAPALALSTVSGLSLELAIVLMGILATAYTALGGLAAVLWTDVVQFVILVGGAIWVAVSLAGAVPGGAGAIFDAAGAAGHLQVLDWRPSFTEMTGLAVGLTFFLQMMQDYGTDQVTVQRLMSVKTDRGLAKAIVFNACSDFFIIALLLFIGLGLFTFYQLNPTEGLADLKADQVLPFYILHGLPDGISGLIVTAIFAAAMSSMDSGINSLATVISNDFVKPFRKDARDDHRTVTRARWYTVGLGIFATLAAFGVQRIGDIIDAFATFMSLFSAPILALFLLGIFTRRGRFGGWLVAVVISVPATLWLQRGTDVNWTYYFPFAFLVTMGVAYLVSLFLRGPEAPAELTIYGRDKEPEA